MVSTGPVVAFADRDPESPGLVVRVNFGMLTGREATPAEIDILAQQLLPEIGAVSIVAEDRHVIGEHAESSLHQVVIEVDEDRLPESAEEVEALSARLVEEAVRWVDSCAAERHVEIG
jgi:hypothetical protein